MRGPLASRHSDEELFWDVFLSHRHADSGDRARSVHQRLSHEGYRVFLDTNRAHIQGSVEQDVIAQAKRSKVLVLLLSARISEDLESKSICDELRLAKKFIVIFNETGATEEQEREQLRSCLKDKEVDSKALKDAIKVSKRADNEHILEVALKEVRKVLTPRKATDSFTNNPVGYSLFLLWLVVVGLLFAKQLLTVAWALSAVTFGLGALLWTAYFRRKILVYYGIYVVEVEITTLSQMLVWEEYPERKIRSRAKWTHERSLVTDGAPPKFECTVTSGSLLPTVTVYVHRDGVPHLLYRNPK